MSTSAVHPERVDFSSARVQTRTKLVRVYHDRCPREEQLLERSGHCLFFTVFPSITT